MTDEVVKAADVVITMGSGDACPIHPGKRYEDWDVDYPATPISTPSGSSAAKSASAYAGCSPNSYRQPNPAVSPQHGSERRAHAVAAVRSGWQPLRMAPRIFRAGCSWRDTRPVRRTANTHRCTRSPASSQAVQLRPRCSRSSPARSRASPAPRWCRSSASLPATRSRSRAPGAPTRIRSRWARDGTLRAPRSPRRCGAPAYPGANAAHRREPSFRLAPTLAERRRVKSVIATNALGVARVALE